MRPWYQSVALSSSLWSCIVSFWLRDLRPAVCWKQDIAKKSKTYINNKNSTSTAIIVHYLQTTLRAYCQYCIHAIIMWLYVLVSLIALICFNYWIQLYEFILRVNCSRHIPGPPFWDVVWNADEVSKCICEFHKKNCFSLHLSVWAQIFKFGYVGSLEMASHVALKIFFL